ncbi:MAG: hypothetical protein AAFX06_02980 [Planctomycetota bacterium]
MDRSSSNRTSSLRTPLIGGIVASLLTFGVLLKPSPDSAPEVERKTPEPTVSVNSTSKPVDARNEAMNATLRRAQFYDDTVSPLLAETECSNIEAATRCLDRLDQVMTGYHAGVPLFVAEMTSIKTRLGILKRMPGGWWAKDGRVEAYVQEKFEAHLFSEQKLVDDLSEVLEQFRRDIDANQSALLVRVKAELRKSDLPEVELGDHEAFFRELSRDLNVYAADQGTTSVQNLVGAFVLGEVGAFAARSVIAGLLTRFAPSVAISGAGATAGASATGAGTGALGGPIGAVVGFGAGLAVGLVIDWWMTEQFESKLNSELNQYLDDLHETLVLGHTAGGTDKAGALDTVANGPSSAAGGADGLKSALPRVCQQLSEAYRDRFFTQIVSSESVDE